MRGRSQRNDAHYRTLKARLAQPSHLVHRRAAELKGIEESGGMLTIGAGTRHVEVVQSDKVNKAIPALAYLAGRIGDLRCATADHRRLGVRTTIRGGLSRCGAGARCDDHDRSAQIAADDFFSPLPHRVGQGSSS